MKSKIQKILERELSKLDSMSSSTIDPLSPQDVKSLDVLIKAYRSFVAPEATPSSGSSQPGESGSSRLSDSDLINELTSANKA